MNYIHDVIQPFLQLHLWPIYNSSDGHKAHKISNIINEILQAKKEKENKDGCPKCGLMIT